MHSYDKDNAAEERTDQPRLTVRRFQKTLRHLKGKAGRPLRSRIGPNLGSNKTRIANYSARK